MLVLLNFANKFKLANYYIDGATYVSSLKVNNFNSKKALAIDSISFNLHTEVFDSIGESLAYICYNTLVDVYLDEQKVMQGYVDKLATSSTTNVRLTLRSLVALHSKLTISPQIENTCQNQVYSYMCGLNKNDFACEFTNVTIDCFTGLVTLDIDGVAGTASLGGSPSATFPRAATTAPINNPLFLKKENWWNAFVILNDVYRATVVNVSESAITLDINHLEATVTASNVKVYLKCDKTYGTCYKRFSNTKNFWGFPNNGNKIQTLDIFSASSLEYCGADYSDQEFEYCDTDFNIFGVNINE